VSNIPYDHLILLFLNFHIFGSQGHTPEPGTG
jgi:hypothetical protein